MRYTMLMSYGKIARIVELWRQDVMDEGSALSAIEDLVRYERDKETRSVSD